VQTLGTDRGLVGFLTPGGQPLTQRLAENLSESKRLILVCGRYEGFDERVFTVADFQVSIGDYVLTGGELPAMVLIDAVVRLLPGVLGDESSADDETFTESLLEYPQYTRPPVYRGLEVPDVLRSGDHARIASWRREQSVRRTARVRPDLLARAELTEAEREMASQERADTQEEGRS
jgi:tRNA (guanine37-N1)-methyltransferase